MSVHKFAFHDRQHGWNLDEIEFKDFNLLVGLSGVGKTRILKAIQFVVNAATKDAINENGDSVDEASWMIEIVEGNERYRWEAETTFYTPDDDFEYSGLTKEKIWRNDEVIVERNGEYFKFNNADLPKLKMKESAISMLRGEREISPFFRALSRFVFSEASSLSYSGRLPYKLKDFEQGIAENLGGEKYRTVNDLRETGNIHLFLKAYILQKKFPEEFARIKESYSEIFPTVLDAGLIGSDTGEGIPLLWKGQSMEWLYVGIQERGVQESVYNERISAGMLRTFAHLLEITLAPSGTVIIVDEFENGLGINCLPQMTDHFLRRSDLQFILTSHHPYVINKIPWEYWKLVTRKGPEVTVKDVASIPSFDAKSLHSRFVLLTNLDEYQEAIQ